MSRSIEDFDCFWLGIGVTSMVPGSRKFAVFCCICLNINTEKCITVA